MAELTVSDLDNFINFLRRDITISIENKKVIVDFTIVPLTGYEVANFNNSTSYSYGVCVLDTIFVNINGIQVTSNIQVGGLGNPFRQPGSYPNPKISVLNRYGNDSGTHAYLRPSDGSFTFTTSEPWQGLVTGVWYAKTLTPGENTIENKPLAKIGFDLSYLRLLPGKHIIVIGIPKIGYFKYWTYAGAMTQAGFQAREQIRGDGIDFNDISNIDVIYLELIIDPGDNYILNRYKIINNLPEDIITVNSTNGELPDEITTIPIGSPYSVVSPLISETLPKGISILPFILGFGVGTGGYYLYKKHKR